MNCLGDKTSLEKMLHETTGIPIEVFRTRSLVDYGVEQRLSWAAKRQTTREEDMAYCLLGILNIHLPLLYGEGKENAMNRLRKMAESATEGPTGVLLKQKLSGLRQWLSASNLSRHPENALSVRLQGTGHWLLDSCKYARWETTPASFLWLHGRPGSGKTVVSATILEDLMQSCSRQSTGISAHFYFDCSCENPDMMLRSLISQLSHNCSRMPASLDALFALRDSGQGLPSLQTLLEALKQMILEFPQVFILIEALDECRRRQELMDVLETVAGWHLDSLHLLVTSRKEQDIASSVEGYIKENNTICLRDELSNDDVQRYIQWLVDNKIVEQ
jgi:hypothetical protein